MIDLFVQSRMVMYANVTANGDRNPYCTASLRDKKLHFITVQGLDPSLGLSVA